MPDPRYLETLLITQRGAGADPEWVRQLLGASLVMPSSVGAGNPTQDALVTDVVLMPREQPAYRTAVVTIPTFVANSDYAVTIDGTDVNFNSDPLDDAAEVLVALAAAITAHVVVNLLVTATAVDTDEDNIVDALVIKGIAVDDYTIDVATAGGSVLLATADIVSATARIWVQFKGANANTPIGWLKVNGATDIDVPLEGYTVGLSTAPVQRVYVEIASVVSVVGDGTVTNRMVIAIGPSVVF